MECFDTFVFSTSFAYLIFKIIVHVNSSLDLSMTLLLLIFWKYRYWSNWSRSNIYVNFSMKNCFSLMVSFTACPLLFMLFWCLTVFTAICYILCNILYSAVFVSFIISYIFANFPGSSNCNLPVSVKFIVVLLMSSVCFWSMWFMWGFSR